MKAKVDKVLIALKEPPQKRHDFLVTTLVIQLWVLASKLTPDARATTGLEQFDPPAQCRLTQIGLPHWMES